MFFSLVSFSKKRWPESLKERTLEQSKFSLLRMLASNESVKKSDNNEKHFPTRIQKRCLLRGKKKSESDQKKKVVEE